MPAGKHVFNKIKELEKCNTEVGKNVRKILDLPESGYTLAWIKCKMLFYL